MQFVPGMIVKSDAGRDQERFYVIVAEKNGGFFIADGKRRKLAKPKRKNPRHLKRTAKKVDLSEVDTNQKLRRVLRRLNNDRPEAVVSEGGNSACQNKM